jgi:hypothetical protein
MIVERRPVFRFYATRVVDSNELYDEESRPVKQRKHFASKHAAYVWTARGFLFRIRNACPNCPTWLDENGQRGCDKHNDEWFCRAAKRVARLLKYWDRRLQ